MTGHRLVRGCAVLVTALLVLPVRARADEPGEGAAALRIVGEFEVANREGKARGSDAGAHFKDDPRRCREAIARGKHAHLRPTALARASRVCDEYARLRPLIEAAQIVAGVIGQHTIARAVNPVDVGQDWIADYRKAGADCLSRIDALTKAGLPTDVAIPVNQDPMTIPAAADRYCGDLVRWADAFTPGAHVVDAKERARLAAVRARWARSGVKGDRLDALADHDGDAWYVDKRGTCTPLTGGALKKAKVMYRRLSDGEQSHTLIRYEFKGDTLVRTSERFFESRAKAAQGCR